MPAIENTITSEDVFRAAKLSHLDSFTGKYAVLEGGEFNDTFVLDCGQTKAVLRIARHTELANLHREAMALGLLNLDRVPRLIHYDDADRIKSRSWIMESYLQGRPTSALSLKQFASLGELLGQVHQVRSNNANKVDYWAAFVDAYQQFGNEQFLRNHPDERLSELVNRGREYFQSQPTEAVELSLVHGDISRGNILTTGDLVSLIDWEYAKFKDPMADFSALYYEDIEYNEGKWRIKIKDSERKILFTAYQAAGGVVDQERIKVWINFDKLGNCIYLYWKIHQSGHQALPDRLAQYRVDLNNLTASLERNLPHISES